MEPAPRIFADTTLSALRLLVEQLKQRRPDLATRAEKAAAIVLLRDVCTTDQARVYLVGSETRPDQAYRVNLNDRACSCPDSEKAPDRWCKHRIAVALIGKVQALHEAEAQAAAHRAHRADVIGAAMARDVREAVAAAKASRG
jgi:uncharacterized Zn finger protein